MRFNQSSFLTYTSDRQSINRHYLGEHLFCLSSIKQIACPVKTYDYAIKFVSSGHENYYSKAFSTTISDQSYLVTNKDHELDIVIDDIDYVHAICINLKSSLIHDIIRHTMIPDSTQPDIDLSAHFKEQLFIRHTSHISKNRVGQSMYKLDQAIKQQSITLEDLNQDFFYDLGERLVKDQYEVALKLDRIPALKRLTKLDLFKRVLEGKSFLEAHVLNPIVVSDAAKYASLSEFHFYRLFKQIMGISPLQFIISLRMDYALSLMKQGANVTTAALSCGFSDIHSFSKAFKKHFSTSPSSYLKIMQFADLDKQLIRI